MSVQDPELTPAAGQKTSIFDSRHYTLIILTLVYISSFVDRQIISILLQPIKEEFGVSDAALGVLGGFSFAIFYATLGIPVAMLADRANRRNLIALAVTIWSAMTALGGVAQNFTQLLLARIGVGVGEAGSGPPSHSMIADLYPLQERTRAMAIYSSGIHIGGSLGSLVGGFVAFYYGWREALLVVGLPGLLIALIVRYTLREPIRGQSDGNTEATPDLPLSTAAKQVFRPASFKPLKEGFLYFWHNHTLRHLLIGCTLVAFIGYGTALYGAAYLMRMFEINVRDVGIIAMAGSMFAVAGAIFAAWVADRWGSKDPRWVSWIVAVTKLAALPLILLYYYQDDMVLALCFYFPLAFLGSTYQGSTFSMVQTLSPTKMRAQSSAILLFVINLIGMGLGPTFVGFISDTLKPIVGDDTQSLRWAMVIISCIAVWGCYHYYLAGKSYPADLAKIQAEEGN